MSLFSSAPLARQPLTTAEKVRLQALLDPLVGFLGRPGDWGYGTKLGDLAIRLRVLQDEVALHQTKE